MSFYISDVLIEWYNDNKRSLPWRGTKNPYVIWISEIILQQTRVEQGRGYFLNFAERFPDVQSLASASEDEVLKYWQGLGYYGRARNLHHAAKDIIARFNGVFPEKYEDVLSLKGVGEYTAGAICSIAYNAPYVAVDGNVFRVLSRLFAMDTPIDTGSGKKLFTETAKEILNPEFAGEHNQAIMEFGALRCVPQSPNCSVCPLHDGCAAFLQNKVSSFPVKQGKTTQKGRYFNYFYVLRDDCTFLNKRTGKDIWQGLYEFPLIETQHSTTFETLSVSAEYKNMFSGLEEISVDLQHYYRKHILSHQIIHARIYKIHIKGNNEYFTGLTKCFTGDFEQFPVSGLIHGYLNKEL